MEKKTQYVRSLTEKETVQAPFLVKSSNTAVDKNGNPYMTLTVMDRTGELEARVWDNVSDYANQAIADAFVFIEGKCQFYQGRKQVIIKKLRVLREDEIELEEYVKKPPESVSIPDLLRELDSYVESMEDPFYKALAKSIMIDDEDVRDRIKRAPAAKTVHHAYTGGLLEHIISITKTLDFMASHYAPYVDRDLLFLGGFLHDIGKIWELSYERITDYTDEGRLIGHLVMGVELIERKVRHLEENNLIPGDFPEDKKLLVKHMVLAHHGKYEYGSPKRPKCLEALLVHYIDDLDSKMNAIRVFIEQDQTTGLWTALNKQYQRYFYKPDWSRQLDEF